RVGGLQADFVALSIEALQGGIRAFDQRHDNVAIVCDFCSFDQNIVTAENGFVLHGISAHFEDKNLFRAHKVGEGNSFGALDSLNRLTGGDSSHERQHHASVDRHGLLHTALGRQQINRAAAIIVAIEQTFFLEVRDVLVYGGERAQSQAVANFLIGGGEL